MSAYVLDAKAKVTLTRLPLRATLKDGVQVELTEVHDTKEHTDDLHRLCDLLNAEIADGGSYPQETPLSVSQFKAYFLSHNAFVCKAVGVTGPDAIVGTFYIKPNFPGRAAHICNGGFIVAPHRRRYGVARFLAESFEVLAVDLGYRASFFNLVFASNTASVKLWQALGYEQTGRVPDALRLNDGTYVSALQFYNQFGVTRKANAAKAAAAAAAAGAAGAAGVAADSTTGASAGAVAAAAASSSSSSAGGSCPHAVRAHTLLYAAAGAAIVAAAGFVFLRVSSPRK